MPRRSSGLFPLKFHFLDHLLDDLERAERFLFMDVGQSEHLHGFVESFCRGAAQRLLTKNYETVRDMSGALDSAQRPETKIHGRLLA